MSTLVTSTPRTIPSEVQVFAGAKGISHYLSAAIRLACQAFPSSSVSVSLDRDAEDESHQYIALDADVGGLTTEELLVGQRVWSERIGEVCPSSHAVYFVLGWR